MSVTNQDPKKGSDTLPNSTADDDDNNNIVANTTPLSKRPRCAAHHFAVSTCCPKDDLVLAPLCLPPPLPSSRPASYTRASLAIPSLCHPTTTDRLSMNHNEEDGIATVPVPDAPFVPVSDLDPIHTASSLSLVVQHVAPTMTAPECVHQLPVNNGLPLSQAPPNKEHSHHMRVSNMNHRPSASWLTSSCAAGSVVDDGEFSTGRAIVSSLESHPEPLGYSFIHEGGGPLSRGDRRILVNWLAGMAFNCDLRKATYGVAVRLLDELLAVGGVSVNHAYLIASTCLFIASKLDELDHFGVRAFAKMIHVSSHASSNELTYPHELRLYRVVISTANGNKTFPIATEPITTIATGQTKNNVVVKIPASKPVDEIRQVAPKNTVGNMAGYVSDRTGGKVTNCQSQAGEVTVGTGGQEDTPQTEAATNSIAEKMARAILRAERFVLDKLLYDVSKQTSFGVIEWMAKEAILVLRSGCGTGTCRCIEVAKEGGKRLSTDAHFLVMVGLLEERVAGFSGAALAVAAVRVALCVNGLDAEGVAQWADVKQVADAVIALIEAWHAVDELTYEEREEIIVLELSKKEAAMFRLKEDALTVLMDNIHHEMETLSKGRTPKCKRGTKKKGMYLNTSPCTDEEGGGLGKEEEDQKEVMEEVVDVTDTDVEVEALKGHKRKRTQL